MQRALPGRNTRHPEAYDQASCYAERLYEERFGDFVMHAGYISPMTEGKALYGMGRARIVRLLRSGYSFTPFDSS